MDLTVHALQTKMLYVFDPKALEAIVSKDGVVFDESRCFLLWVLISLSTKSFFFMYLSAVGTT